MSAATATELAALVRRARVLLLDFDGPICSIFAGRPASLVARELADALTDDGQTVPADVRGSHDPFDVFRFAATLGDAAAERTEARLREAEIAAVPSARQTPEAAALIESWVASGRPVAAVSNNSEAAVAAYVTRHRLQVSPVVGRTSPNPALLKPNPHLIDLVLSALGASPEDALFVGDSPSDMEAGRQARVPVLGYANKPGKTQRLAAAGARAIVDDLRLLEAGEGLKRRCSQPTRNPPT